MTKSHKNVNSSDKLLNLNNQISKVQWPSQDFKVEWPSQNFKDDLDIDYIWVFISYYVDRGIGGPKKPNLPLPSVGKIFYDALKPHRQKTFKKLKYLPNITLLRLI